MKLLNLKKNWKMIYGGLLMALMLGFILAMCGPFGAPLIAVIPAVLVFYVLNGFLMTVLVDLNAMKNREFILWTVLWFPALFSQQLVDWIVK